MQCGSLPTSTSPRRAYLRAIEADRYYVRPWLGDADQAYQAWEWRGAKADDLRWKKIPELLQDAVSAPKPDGLDPAPPTGRGDPPAPEACRLGAQTDRRHPISGRDRQGARGPPRSCIRPTPGSMPASPRPAPRSRWPATPSRRPRRPCASTTSTRTRTRSCPR